MEIQDPKHTVNPELYREYITDEGKWEVNNMKKEKSGVIFVGDTHGNFEVFRQFQKAFTPDLPVSLISVGDFGYWPKVIDSWPEDFPWKVYFIDGNHDYYPWMVDITDITEVRSNLYYIPRGSTMVFEGKTFGFVGGAFTPDYVVSGRQMGHDWFPNDESVKEKDIQKLWDKHIDVLVTHTPPTSAILTHFGPLDNAGWGLPMDVKDTSSPLIERLWEHLRYPQLYCGHMHKAVKHGTCRILDINELLGWEMFSS